MEQPPVSLPFVSQVGPFVVSQDAAFIVEEVVVVMEKYIIFDDSIVDIIEDPAVGATGSLVEEEDDAGDMLVAHSCVDQNRLLSAPHGLYLIFDD